MLNPHLIEITSERSASCWSQKGFYMQFFNLMFEMFGYATAFYSTIQGSNKLRLYSISLCCRLISFIGGVLISTQVRNIKMQVWSFIQSMKWFLLWLLIRLLLNICLAKRVQMIAFNNNSTWKRLRKVNHDIIKYDSYSPDGADDSAIA